MLGRYALRLLFLFLCVCCIRSVSLAQQDQVERNLWYNEEKTAKIQIFKATDGKFYGKIVWLKVPEVDGKTKVDIHNPDPAKRGNPILGLLLLKGLKKDGKNGYEDGTIYDPKNGKTYSCKATYKGDKLDMRGYIGFSLIGRTTTWTKAD
ncbi:MAG: DUF2147 domain-containing protein [Bacteroidota bacterium]